MKLNRHVVYLLICALLLGAVPVATYLNRSEKVSYYENRNLAVFTWPTWEQLWDGTALTEMEKTAADRIAGRNVILKADTALQLLLRRQTVDGILVTPEFISYYYNNIRWDLGYLTGQAQEAAGRYAQLAQTVESYGGRFCFLGLPFQSAYFADRYPSYTDSRAWHTNGIRSAFAQAMAEQQVDFLDMHTVFESMGCPPELYSTTDHHYTFQGAFVTFQALAEHLDGALGSPQKEDFIWETLPNPFLGSFNRELYDLYPSSEKLEVAYPKDEIPFTRRDNGHESDARIFSLPPTDQERVTYSLYMGGDMGETVITTNRPELPNVLIYGDSFTNPLETLLWTRCNELRSLDLRYYKGGSLIDYIAQFQPDLVICVRDETFYLNAAGNGATT